MFWDVPDDPRGALRWSLSKLRQILNADGETRLEADRNAVQLKRGSFRLDYDLIRGLSPDAIASLPTERLEAIAAAFAGPFLSDLYLPRCQEFEAWRVYCSNETEILRLKVLRALIGRLGDEPERALAHLHALQSLLPGDDLAAEIAGINDRARSTAAARHTPADTAIAILERPSSEAGMQDPPRGPIQLPAVHVSSGKQQIRYVQGRDGTRIAYAVSGSGPAIVRASHWMSHLDFDWESPVWGHWIDALSSGFTLVRYDGRLNGLSDTICQDISFEAFVDDLERVVEAAGLDRFVLLGISQGCALSTEYALRHPEKVAGLVIVGGLCAGMAGPRQPGGDRQARGDFGADARGLGTGRPVVSPDVHRPVHSRRQSRADGLVQRAAAADPDARQRLSAELCICRHRHIALARAAQRSRARPACQRRPCRTALGRPGNRQDHRRRPFRRARQRQSHPACRGAGIPQFHRRGLGICKCSAAGAGRGSCRSADAAAGDDPLGRFPACRSGGRLPPRSRAGTGRCHARARRRAGARKRRHGADDFGERAGGVVRRARAPGRSCGARLPDRTRAAARSGTATRIR